MDIPVIDFHAHLGTWGRFGKSDSPDLYLRCMDNAGIDVACINYIAHGDAYRGNDRVGQYVQKWPRRFVGAAFVTPHYPDEMVRELERCFDQLGMKFIKVYPHYVRVALDNPLYFPIYEFANQRKLTIMSHAKDYFDPPSISIYDRYAGLVKRFPQVTWVMAHAGGGRSAQDLAGSALDETMKAVREFPNIYLETCGSALHNGGIEFAIKNSRADRVLFGTDMPLMDASQQLAKVIVSEVSQEEKRLVLGGNAMRLLELDPPNK